MPRKGPGTVHKLNKCDYFSIIHIVNKTSSITQNLDWVIKTATGNAMVHIPFNCNRY